MFQRNERADRLAKQASNELYTGLEPAPPVSHMAGKSAIRDRAHKKAQARWESTNICRQAKVMIATISRIRTRCLIRPPRRMLRLVVGVMSDMLI